MNTPELEHPWTDAELELFHDGELPGRRGEALSEALRTSPTLRARAAAIARADAMIARALELQPGRAAGAAPRSPARFRIAAAILAFSVCALVVGVWWASLPTTSPVEPRAPLAHRDPPALDPLPSPMPKPDLAAEPYRPIRVVFSLPAGEPRPPRPAPQRPEPINPAPPAFITRLDTALAMGRVDEAIELVRQAGPDEKQEAYRRFGSALRSSDTAMAALDVLSPEEQVAACKQWIAAGQQRPFAMARLKLLSRRAELEEPIRTAVRDLLADDPNLRTWVMSYIPWTLEKS